MMLPAQRRAARSQSLRILLAFLCVALVVFIGSAQLLHMHAGAENSDPGCSLCAVAHLSALATPEHKSPVVAELVHALPPAEDYVAPPSFPAYTHESRPPPVVTA